MRKKGWRGETTWKRKRPCCFVKAVHDSGKGGSKPLHKVRLREGGGRKGGAEEAGGLSIRSSWLSS